MDGAIGGGATDGHPRSAAGRWRGALAALLAITLIGIVAERTLRAPWLMWADNLHWTAGYAAGLLLAWRGYAEAEDALMRLAKGWLLAGLALLFAGQLVWNAQVAADWLVFLAASDVFPRRRPVADGGPVADRRARLSATEWLATRLDAATMLVAVLAATLALFLPRQAPTAGCSRRCW
ncbi:MAG: hypothetical protein U1F67_11290 [Rubrivivax sp.]